MAKDKDNSFENIDFDLFEALTALDKKDYSYYDRLTSEQQRKFVPYMMILWMSAVKGSPELSGYYLMNTDYTANKYFFNENIMKHPKLQWLMLCASSPGLGKQFHQWIPHIKERVSRLQETAKTKDIKEYYKKIYSKASEKDITELSGLFVEQQKRKVYLAEKFPSLKISDIEVLNDLVTDQEIQDYEKESGNI